MSTYGDYLNEKQKIDDLIDQDYVISGVTEDLDGASVEFQKDDKNEKEILRIGNADARKYFSSVIAKQQKTLSK